MRPVPNRLMCVASGLRFTANMNEDSRRSTPSYVVVLVMLFVTAGCLGADPGGNNDDVDGNGTGFDHTLVGRPSLNNAGGPLEPLNLDDGHMAGPPNQMVRR